MKKVLLFFILSTYYSSSFSQSITCQDLKESIVENANLISSISCSGSSMLVKAQYFKYKDKGYVIAYLKSDQYDFNGTPYMYCGISSERWYQFVSIGKNGSWGKSFNEYIKNLICNCK